MLSKTLLIIIFVFLLVFIAVIYTQGELPPKEDRSILGYPSEHNKGLSKNSSGGTYYFEHHGSLYYHAPAYAGWHPSEAFDRKIINGHPKTFTIIDSNFAKDKNQVYYWGKIVDKADPDTFRTLDWPRAKDKNYYFSQTEITGEIEK